MIDTNFSINFLSLGPLRAPPKGERIEADLNLPPFGGIRGGHVFSYKLFFLLRLLNSPPLKGRG